MPTEDTEKIRNAAVYIDGKAIKGIQEIKLPEKSITMGTFVEKLKRLIRIECLVFIAKHRGRGR